jgi:hypothetical protein
VKGILAAALLFIAARPMHSAQDDPNLRRIQSLLAKPSMMCGRFEQAKTLVGLRRPVRSSGRFCVVLDKGVLWTTILPFPATLRLTKDEIVESHGAQVTKRLSARDEPTVGIINDLLSSLLQGDLGRLTASFAVTSAVDDREWSARLVPKDAGMKHVIAGIELNGGAFVKQIMIREASGDTTEITFSAIATGTSALLPEEARQFDAPAGDTPHPDVHER